MKKLLLIILLVSANISYAGESTLSPIVGVTKFDRTFLLISNSNLVIENNLSTYGIAYRYHFDNGAEVNASYSTAEGSFVASDLSYSGDLEVTNLNININYRFNSNGLFQPYLGIGPVYTKFKFSTKSGSGGPNRTFDSTRKILIRAGLDYQISKKINIGAVFDYSEFDYSNIGVQDYFEGNYRRLFLSAGYTF